MLAYRYLFGQLVSRELRRKYKGSRLGVLRARFARPASHRGCDRVVVLEAGQVVFSGPTAEGLLHYHRMMGTQHHAGALVRPDGRRAIEVSEVELRDELGRSGSVFHTRQSLQIQVELRALQAVGRGRLALGVRAGDGTTIFATHTPLELGPDGNAKLAFEIGDLALLGGDYDLVLGAAPASEEASRERTVRFPSPTLASTRAWSTCGVYGAR